MRFLSGFFHDDELSSDVVDVVTYSDFVAFLSIVDCFVNERRINIMKTQ